MYFVAVCRLREEKENFRFLGKSSKNRKSAIRSKFVAYAVAVLENFPLLLFLKKKNKSKKKNKNKENMRRPDVLVSW